MDSSRVLFASHSRVVSGAEFVLAAVVEDWAGASAFVFEAGPLQETLAARGLQVTTSRAARGLAAVKRDSSVWQAVPLAGRMAVLTAEIAQMARRHDVIYANSQKAFVLCALATAVVRRPLIWHLHDIPDAQHFGKAQLTLQIGLANRRAARVIVPSRAVAEGFVASGGREEIVRIVSAGVEPPKPDDRSRVALRGDLGLPDGPLIGVFSRLAGWKGQHVVIKAMASLPQARCIIAGSALFGENAYAAELYALAETLGVSDRIHFLGQRSDVSTLMRTVDVVVHPSTAPEPFGLTLVESMLVGTPVVATSIGAVSDILDGGRVGTLVAPNDSQALADAVRPILHEPAEYDARNGEALQRARTFYTAERMRSAVSQIIRDVAAEHRR